MLLIIIKLSIAWRLLLIVDCNILHAVAAVQCYVRSNRRMLWLLPIRMKVSLLDCLGIYLQLWWYLEWTGSCSCLKGTLMKAQLPWVPLKLRLMISFTMLHTMEKTQFHFEQNITTFKGHYIHWSTVSPSLKPKNWIYDQWIDLSRWPQVLQRFSLNHSIILPPTSCLFF